MATHHHSLSLLLLLTNLHLISSASYTTLVYKGCAKQPITDPTGLYSQALSSLYSTLISQSITKKFSKTSTGTGQTTLTGLFQCRGDLSNTDCYNCVTKLPILIDKLCGQTMAARIQLTGCYMIYEIGGFPQISGLQMIYKKCGKNQENGFENTRDGALGGLENGISSSSNNNGFYAGGYQGVYALGQCEGDLGISDCGLCVKSAVERVQSECGGSVSGQVYLDKCFVGYSYYPNGIPTKSSSTSFSSPSGAMQNPGKTVAIILGGALVVGFIVICLLFARNSMKKHDDGMCAVSSIDGIGELCHPFNRRHRAKHGYFDD